jgi:hypothetical protein
MTNKFKIPIPGFLEFGNWNLTTNPTAFKTVGFVYLLNKA